jgi:hypothetical protein
MSYTYLCLRKELFNQKDERKTIPMLEFENTWNFRLQTLQKFNELLKDKKIVKTSGFYPRCVDTKQAGIRVWKELLRTHFKDTDDIFYDHEFLETLLKRKRIPQVYFNSICYFDFDENIDQIINVSNLELKFLEWSKDIPLPPPAYDVNNVDTKNKMQIVINMVKETEFTHDEKLALIILIIATLKE